MVLSSLLEKVLDYRRSENGLGIVVSRQQLVVDIVERRCYGERSMFQFLSQGHAEDIVLWHRYNYYVLGAALIADALYDALERAVCSQWSVCLCGIGGCVGSDALSNYPRYIQLGVRPNEDERRERDAAIAQRWLANL